VVALGAGGGNVELLAAQALELGVEVVGVARSSVVQDLQLAFYAEAQKRGYATGGFQIPKIVAGPDAMTELAAWPCDVVLNGVVGSLGLAPTLAALRVRPYPRAGQQGVAGGRRPAGARPVRGRGRSCRSTRSTRRWPSACAAAPAAEVRRLI
jgi:1-deoxy-D-xylulose-5-phosphate reductoisomerase